MDLIGQVGFYLFLVMLVGGICLILGGILLIVPNLLPTGSVTSLTLNIGRQLAYLPSSPAPDSSSTYIARLRVRIRMNLLILEQS